MITKKTIVPETNVIKQNQKSSIDYSKIKVDGKPLEDAIINLERYTRFNKTVADKSMIMRAMQDNDFATMRDVSDYFYRTSGIYNRLCRYMAYMYRYDWYVTPFMNEDDSVNTKKILVNFHKVLKYLDDFEVKRRFGEIALKVIRRGCYYGYIIRSGDKAAIQELPYKYCRSRFTTMEGRPVIEFNMRFFDDMFRDINQRMRMLKLFPEEFQKGYILYKKGKLLPDYAGDSSGWYLLDVSCAIKFNINGEDFPIFMSVIPAIIDLDNAQGLDKKKMQQQLLKILIQKMPINKDGDMVFDPDEAQVLHNNAVKMLSRAIGIDVLTTFADVEVADMAQKANTTTDDTMSRIKDAIYDQAGVSSMQFNTDGNLSLEKSMLNDAATIYNLIEQFQSFLNMLISDFNKSPKKVYYRAEMLPTTIYNYQELAKLYKEGMQLGYSKMLFQVALGHSQSSILATAYFENDVLDLVNVFIPPMSTNTMNAEVLRNNGLKGGGGDGGSTNPNSSQDGKKGGRPEKPEGQKSDKTLKNEESK